MLVVDLVVMSPDPRKPGKVFQSLILTGSFGGVQDLP